MSTDTTHARKSSSARGLAVPVGGDVTTTAAGNNHAGTTTGSNNPLSPSGRSTKALIVGGATASAATLPSSSYSSTTTARLAWNMNAHNPNHNNNAAAANNGTMSIRSSHQYYYLQRLMDVRQMDVQAALDQMRTLLSLRPQLVYKTAYYRKQTKNHWSRDDPAFLVLQLVFLSISCGAYAIAFKADVSDAFSFWTASIVWNWLLCGVAVATCTQSIANKYLQTHHQINLSRTTHVQQNVEWLYAFDIHCNSFFPVFCVLYGVQFFTLPVVLGDGLVPLFLADTMYALAFGWYWYITHLGYRALPFLSHTEFFLLPLCPIVVSFASLVVLYPFGYGINAAQFMAKFYFM